MNCFHLTWLGSLKVLNTLVLKKLFVGRQSNWISQSKEHDLMWRSGKSINTFNLVFLHCHTISISLYFNNCWSFEHRMVEISFIQSLLWRQHHHSTSSTVTEPLLHLSTTKASSRWRVLVQGVYTWWQHSSANSLPSVPDNVAVEVTELLAGAASGRWLCCSRRGSSYWRACLRLSCGKGQRKAWKNTLVVAWNGCLLAPANPQHSGGPAGCSRANRAQERTKQLHIVCTQMYQYILVCIHSIRKKSAIPSIYQYVPVYTSMYKFRKFHTDIYGHIRRFTYTGMYPFILP